MLTERVNLWERYEIGNWIAITTNGFVKKNGQAVMGRGCALEAAQRYPNIPKVLGQKIEEHGNRVFALLDLRIVTFPVKWNWFEKADIDLIIKSAYELQEFTDRVGLEKVYLPKPGCGNGQLQWSDVRPRIEPILSDKVIVVDFPKRKE